MLNVIWYVKNASSDGLDNCMCSIVIMYSVEYFLLGHIILLVKIMYILQKVKTATHFLILNKYVLIF